MVRTRVLIIVVVLALLLMPLLYAAPPTLSCLSDADCSYCSSFDAVCHCDKSAGAASGLCVTQSATPPPPALPPVSPPAPNVFVTTPEEIGVAFPEELPLENDAPLNALEQRVTLLEQQATSLSEKITQFESLLQSLQQQVGIVSNKQELSSLETEQQLNTLSTGLAGLQKEINTTSSQLQNVRQNVQQQESATTNITYALIIALVLIAAGVGGYFFLRETKTKTTATKVQPEVLSYITSHIKSGKKFPEIRENLLKAGWSEGDIQTAYKDTMRHNYQQYQQQKGTSTPHSDNIKIASIAIVSVLVLVGVFFLLRGVTGQAIHFSSERELNAAVKGNLEISLRNREFPPLVNTATICVEVHDLAASVSYRVIKLPDNHLIQEAPLPCSEDNSYDLALKFNNWDAFNIVTRRMTCEAFQSSHQDKGFYVLPSRYVLPGFTLNPNSDPSSFCPILTKCASPADLLKAGIAC